DDVDEAYERAVRIARGHPAEAVRTDSVPPSRERSSAVRRHEIDHLVVVQRPAPLQDDSLRRGARIHFRHITVTHSRGSSRYVACHGDEDRTTEEDRDTVGTGASRRAADAAAAGRRTPLRLSGATARD